MILLVALFLIIFEAVPEALVLTGHKTLAGIFEGVYLLGVTLGIFAWLNGVKVNKCIRSFWFIIGGYVLVRFALFDVTYNLVAGLPLTYIGTTKITDIMWQEFFALTHFPVGLFFGMLKFICFLIGITWLLKK
jgi:hypothetical protein